MSTLKPPSDEQIDIINKLENKNIIVDSVAGSGKTTVNMHIAKKYKNKNILLLTYNSRLKLETRELCERLNLNNIEVHSYHSFCVKHYDDSCITDSLLEDMLKSNSQPLYGFQYDIILLDESQDMTELYYRLICKICQDNNNPNSKFCVLGDEYQSIYDFNNADSRFIKYADQFFDFNNQQWDRCKLSTSFRVTKPIAKFINKCLLPSDRIMSCKSSKYKPRYIICNTFISTDDIKKNKRNKKLRIYSRVFNEVKYYINLGYTYSDIFILAPSVKCGTRYSPIRSLANLLTKNHIPIYIPISDEESLDLSILENKITFSTFHQVKGLERKVVIIFNFDSSLFQYYLKTKKIDICPNPIYVAITRALERVSLLHDRKHSYLPFLNKKNLKLYCDVEISTNKYNQDEYVNQNIHTNDPKISVTKLTKHLPYDIVNKCMTYININKIQSIPSKINISTKTLQTYGHEAVSEITGLAIPIFFEYKMFNNIGIYYELKRHKKYKKLMKDLDISKITSSDILYLSNLWNSYKNNLMFKVKQISDYNWLPKYKLKLCMDRLCALKLSKNCKFEQHVNYNIHHGDINGYIDCIDNTNIYEFKCVSELKNEHYIQLAIYIYLHWKETAYKWKNELKQKYISESKNRYKIGDTIKFKYRTCIYSGIIEKCEKKICVKKNNTTYNIYPNKIIENHTYICNKLNEYQKMRKSFRYYLYNILTDELSEIICDRNKLSKLIECIISHKYKIKQDDQDQNFIAKILKIKKNYINTTNNIDEFNPENDDEFDEYDLDDDYI